MRIIRTVSELRVFRAAELGHNITGLVPTMGDLHEGHLNLVQHSREHCAKTIVSIFVNPLQFGANEDFDKYPRVLERDIKKLEALSVDVLFVPSIQEMYPEGQKDMTRVLVPGISTLLCGSTRPSHFEGVTTVVSKLFHITQPDVAFFGEKDWQQLTIIKSMVRQLNFPIEIKGVPTTRESDGLALSSRNRYLSSSERAIAPNLYSILREIATQVKEGQTNYKVLEESAADQLKELGFEPDYISICSASTLEPPVEPEEELRVFAAARLGRARLIDNIPIKN